MKSFDHAETHVRSILSFIGVTDIETIRTEGVAYGPEKAAEALEHAKHQATKAKLAA